MKLWLQLFILLGALAIPSVVVGQPVEPARVHVAESPPGPFVLAHSPETTIDRVGQNGEVLWVGETSATLRDGEGIVYELVYAAGVAVLDLPADSRFVFRSPAIEGHLLAVNAEGELWAVGKGSTYRVTEATAKSATSFDARGATLAWTEDGGVVVIASLVDGTAERYTIPDAPEGELSIKIRSDGVAVAQIHSAESYQTWVIAPREPPDADVRRATWSPLAPLVRRGDWIGTERGELGVLASDGTTWVGGLDRDDFVDMVEREHLVKAIRLSELAFARPAARKQTSTAVAPAPNNALTGLGTLAGAAVFGPGGLGLRGHECVGADCLRHRSELREVQAPVRFGLFGDQRCVDYDSVTETCAGEALTGPTPALADGRGASNQIVSLDLPPGCAVAEQMMNIAGLGVLICVSDGARPVYARTPDAAEWSAEGELRAVLGDEHVDVLADGTAALWSCDDAGCSAALRRPLAPGSEGAWSTVEGPGILGFRPLPGGELLVFRAGDDATLFDVTHHTAGGEDAVASGIEIDEMITDVAVSVEGCLVAETRRNAGDVGRRRLMARRTLMADHDRCEEALALWYSRATLQVDCGANAPPDARVRVVDLQTDRVVIEGSECPLNETMNPGFYQVYAGTPDGRVVTGQVELEPGASRSVYLTPSDAATALMEIRGLAGVLLFDANDELRVVTRLEAALFGFDQRAELALGARIAPTDDGPIWTFVVAGRAVVGFGGVFDALIGVGGAYGLLRGDSETVTEEAKLIFHADAGLGYEFFDFLIGRIMLELYFDEGVVTDVTAGLAYRF